MNWYILSFLLLGMLFGWATYPSRHLFSEGAHKPAGPGAKGFMESRLLWVMKSTFLWPLLLLAGAYGACRKAMVRTR
jgi:hypothetical protein